MQKISSFKELVVWQRSMELVDEIYKISKELPKSEIYILVSQMIRAAISIPANITEGWARNYKTEFVRFLSIAYASALELETHLLICRKQYPNLDYKQASNKLTEVEKMLSVMIIKIKSKGAHC
jgi:four helix bundle protein